MGIFSEEIKEFPSGLMLLGIVLRLLPDLSKFEFIRKPCSAIICLLLCRNNFDTEIQRGQIV
jgi:hypothetical protein